MRSRPPTSRRVMLRLLPIALVAASAGAVAIAAPAVSNAATVATAATVCASTPFTSLEAESGTPLGGASTTALTAPRPPASPAPRWRPPATPTSTSAAPARACSGRTVPAGRSAS